MLKMSQIKKIRDMAQQGYRIGEIVKETETDHKTVRKYMAKEDYSPAPPVEKEKPSKLDSYKALIDSWLDGDKQVWYKQRHTAKRVHDRLKEETDCDASYSVVQRYIKKLRRERLSKANQELVWQAGSAQADFGEADFYEEGLLVRKKYLTLSFPFSNDGLTQVFGGETAECVCQGLLDIFCFIGGVPPIIVFDNATGVGRRIGERIRLAQLFEQFAAHHRFSVRFCNPESGHEKGNVERKVGYTRSNLFVPIPRFDDIEEYNRRLLPQHEKKAAEPHYKKGEIISTLFEEDRRALLPLPTKGFNVCRYEWLNADGYGKVCLDGKHYYSTRPEYAKQRILVGIRAHTVEILTEHGEILVAHRREYSEQRTDSVDYSTTLATLMRNVGAWHNSGIREQAPQALREYMDEQPRKLLKDCLRMMDELSKQYGFDAAISAMDIAARRGSVNLCDASVLAARITGYGLDTLPENGPPLTVYDDAFLKGGGIQ